MGKEGSNCENGWYSSCRHLCCPIETRCVCFSRNQDKKISSFLLAQQREVRNLGLANGGEVREWKAVKKSRYFNFFSLCPFFAGQCLLKKNISRPLYLLRYGVNLSILLTPGKEIK